MIRTFSFNDSPFKAHFHDIENNPRSEDEKSPTEALIGQLLPTKSTGTPSPGKSNNLDYYINKCKHEISQISFNKTTDVP